MMQSEKNRRKGQAEKKKAEGCVFLPNYCFHHKQGFAFVQLLHTAVSLLHNCHLAGRNSLGSLGRGAAGSVPGFEAYQLLFIYPFVSVRNSACLSCFVSLDSQTVPRIRAAEAADLLQSFLFTEMHAALPHGSKRLLAGREKPCGAPSFWVVPSVLSKD